MAILDAALGVGDHILFNPGADCNAGGTTFGVILRRMTQTEADTWFGAGATPGWVLWALVGGGQWGHALVKASQMLAQSKALGTLSSDLGPSCCPAVPNPI